MATNPMQRKARNSFLLGVVVTLILTSIVIALLILQLKNYKEKEDEEKANRATVWVLSEDVISGQVITTDMLKKQDTTKTMIPSNAIGDMSILENYALTDKEGNEIITEYKNNVATLYVTKNGSKYEIKTEKETGSYYIERNNNKEYIELTQDPIVAKIDMNKNTVLTIDAISKSNEKTTNDLRKQEYNVLVLPTQLTTGEYVDVRLALASGQDYIVISKKQVEIPQVNGVDSEDTIWMRLTEGEIITMNNAIVDAYRLPGAKLYVTTYTEAGIQSAATPTYVPTGDVIQLISQNPNVVDDAKAALIRRYQESYERVRSGNINMSIENNAEGEENLKAKIDESIANSKENRKTYLQSLGGE